MRTLWGSVICSLLVVACASEEPAASKYKKEMNAPTSTRSGDAQGADAELTLGFKEPIDSVAFGLEANPNVDGKTLAEIVASFDYGRDDGQKCSACHNKEEDMGGYWVNAEPNEASPDLDPSKPVAGKAWIGPRGWAVGFINNETKPANIKVLLRAWQAGGWK